VLKIIVLFFCSNLFALSDKELLDKVIMVKKASIEYFIDTEYWPPDIKALINTNYLKDSVYDSISLSSNSSKLNIIIADIDKNNLLSKYLIDGKMVKNTFILTINVPKIAINKLKLATYCSNLYCPTYQ